VSGLPSEPAERHRAVAGRFAELTRGATDWDAPAPVDGWAARDVVRHLVEWFPAFLAGGAGIRLAPGPSVDEDPAGAWASHADQVQGILDDPATAERTFSNPHTGDHPLARAIDQFYVSDVFMHTWDLARSTGQDDTLDAETCEQMFQGMQPIDEILRSSGQYGPRVPVPDDAPAQDRLLGFIGRDPAWRP
jgi:uncharacterized protein (TIGR03086 family)